MKIYVAVGTAALVVLIVCVGVIRYEAQQTREALRDSARNAVSDGLDQSLDKAASPEQVERTIDKIERMMGGSDGTGAKGGGRLEDLPKRIPEMAAPAVDAAKELTREAAGEMRGLVRDVLGGGQAAPGGGAPKNDGLLDQLRGTVEDVTGVRTPGATRDDEADSAADLRRPPPQSQNTRPAATPNSGPVQGAEGPGSSAGRDPASVSVGLPTTGDPSTEIRAPAAGSGGSSENRSPQNGSSDPRRPGDRKTEDLKAEAGDLFNTLRGTVENATGIRAPDIPGLNPEERKPRGYEPPGGAKPSGTGERAPQPGRENGAPSPRSGGPNDGAGPLGAVDGVFDVAGRGARAADDFGQTFVKLSVDDEKRWGKKLHDRVLAQHEVVRSSAVEERIRKVTAPLLANLLRPDIEYTFTVLKSEPDDLNAFSLPGGYVYLHSAVLDFVGADEELQFLLGHEVGHVDLEHCAKKLAYGARVSDLTAPQLGDAVATLHHFISRPYRQDEEYDADYYAFVALIDAGRTRDQTLACPRRFDEYLRKKRGDSGPAGARSSPGLFASVMNKAQDHFSTHPPYDERLRRLEAIDAEAIRRKSTSARRDNAK